MRSVPLLLEVETEKESPLVRVGTYRRLRFSGLGEGTEDYVEWTWLNGKYGGHAVIYQDSLSILPEEAQFVKARYVTEGLDPPNRVTVELEE